MSLSKFSIAIKTRKGETILAHLELQVEEVPIKLIGRLSATEMDTGSNYEIDRKAKCHRKVNTTEMDKI